MRIHRLAIIIVSACAFSTTAACTNRNYVDLMRVTDETEGSIAVLEETYNGDDSTAERVQARSRIIKLREKQMIMAKRINVATMPEVKDKSMTKAEGEAKKAELVAAATKRFEEAKALPIPGKTPPAAK